MFQEWRFTHLQASLCAIWYLQDQCLLQAAVTQRFSKSEDVSDALVHAHLKLSLRIACNHNFFFFRTVMHPHIGRQTIPTVLLPIVVFIVVTIASITTISYSSRSSVSIKATKATLND